MRKNIINYYYTTMPNLYVLLVERAMACVTSLESRRSIAPLVRLGLGWDCDRLRSKMIEFDQHDLLRRPAVCTLNRVVESARRRRVRLFGHDPTPGHKDQIL